MIIVVVVVFIVVFIVVFVLVFDHDSRGIRRKPPRVLSPRNHIRRLVRLVRHLSHIQSPKTGDRIAGDRRGHSGDQHLRPRAPLRPRRDARRRPRRKPRAKRSLNQRVPQLVQQSRQRTDHIIVARDDDRIHATILSHASQPRASLALEPRVGLRRAQKTRLQISQRHRHSSDGGARRPDRGDRVLEKRAHGGPGGASRGVAHGVVELRIVTRVIRPSVSGKNGLSSLDAPRG